MSSDKIRVGAVSYLNTKPLVYRLPEFAPFVDLSFDLPSRLADRLARAELDVALIPSIEYLQEPSYEIVSDACIACRGPVYSVRLLSRVPGPRIRTLALDEGSRTSAALVRILLKQRFGNEPELEQLAIGDDPLAATTDAVLVIGDRAMHVSAAGFPLQWDLGQEWCEWSGLPFVFAMWTARPGVDVADLAAGLERTRDAGWAAAEEIAARESPHAGLPVDMIVRYFRQHLHFRLGPQEQAGLRLFQSLSEQGSDPLEAARLFQNTGAAGEGQTPVRTGSPEQAAEFGLAANP